MFYIAIAVFIMGVAIWLHRAQAAPSLLFGGVFVQTMLGYFAILILTRISFDLTWSLPGAVTPSTVTFKKTDTSNTSVIAPLLIVLAIPVLLWVQERKEAMYYPQLTRWLIWPMLTGGVLINALFLAVLQLVPLSEASQALLTSIQIAAFVAGLLSVLGIYVLALVGFLRRVREEQR